MIKSDCDVSRMPECHDPLSNYSSTRMEAKAWEEFGHEEDHRPRKSSKLNVVFLGDAAQPCHHII